MNEFQHISEQAIATCIEEIKHRVILFLFLSWWKFETPLGREDAGGMKFASREKSRALSQGGGTRFVWKSCAS